MSAKDPKSVSPELVQQLKEILGNKSIFLAVSGSLNNTNRRFEAKDESYMRNNISVTLNGKTYKPISNSKLTEDMKILNDYMKPMFGRMMGEMGAGMTILYFEISDNAGQNLLDPYSNIDFTYSLASVNANFHLPLPSLFTDSKCANDGELFPANYEFCPYHGSKLITQ
jgi:hypothetical protein